jgi:GTP-binding protein HflX
MPKIALVGYTNAGKSSLLNALTDAGVLVEDKLFATLDPTTRKLSLPAGTEALVTDTVGFIKKLPHHLVKAFRSTLEEVKYADICVIVIDASDPERDEQLKVTEELLDSLGAGDKQKLLVYNKCDISEISPFVPDAVTISAKTKFGIASLLTKLEETINSGNKRVRLTFPLSRQREINNLYKTCEIKNTEYLDDKTVITAVLDAKATEIFGEFIEAYL